MRISLKLYRLLLKIYPAGFREDYGVPLQQQFKDDYREAGAHGIGSAYGRGRSSTSRAPRPVS